MSADTRARLDDALRAHLAEEYPDSMLGAYVVVAERVTIEDDGMTRVIDIVPDQQSTMTTIGLLQFVALNRALPPR